MNKSLDYLDLDLKVENYNICRRPTLDKHKLICCYRENYNHKLHSSTNNENFEQLNSIIDLISNFSIHSKTSLDKLNKSIGQLDYSKEESNFSYIKNILEEIFKQTKEDKLNSELKTLLVNTKRIETELTETNKLLKLILYGK